MSKMFAENLKSYRVMAGLTQEDLAKSASITRNAVANYESGRSEPNFEILCKFADVLGVGLDDLLTNEVNLNFTQKVFVTDDELGALQAYREAEPVYQGVALDILRTHKKGG